MLRIWRCGCALCVIGNEFPCLQPHNPSATPLTRAHHIAPRIKTARRFTAKNPWWQHEFLIKNRLKFPKRFCMVGTRYFASAPNGWYSIWYHNYGRAWSTTSISGLVFRRRRVVFYVFVSVPPVFIHRTEKSHRIRSSLMSVRLWRGLSWVMSQGYEKIQFLTSNLWFLISFL